MESGHAPHAAATSLPMLCLLGPSGVGKSAVAATLARDHDWLHLDLDRPGCDARAALALEAEFAALLEGGDAAALAAALAERTQAARRGGCVLTFPSSVLFGLRQVEAIAAHAIAVAYLCGPPATCLDSFLRREAANGRALDARHWHEHNARLLAALEHPALAPYRVAAFAPDGRRRREPEIAAELRARTAQR